MLNKEAILQWADELDSGKHVQGRGSLRYEIKGITYECCLGVASDLFRDNVEGTWHDAKTGSDRIEYGFQWPPFKRTEFSLLPQPVAEYLGLTNQGCHVLGNDRNGHPIYYEFDFGVGKDLSLIAGNDEIKATFPQIAQALRKLVQDIGEPIEGENNDAQ